MKIPSTSHETRLARQQEIFSHLEAVVVIGSHYRKIQQAGYWTDVPADTRTITYYYKILQQAGYDISPALKWELLQLEVRKLYLVLQSTLTEETRREHEKDLEAFLEAAETLLKKQVTRLDKTNHFYKVACDEAQKSAFRIIMTEIIREETTLIENLNASVEQLFFR